MGGGQLLQAGTSPSSVGRVLGDLRDLPSDSSLAPWTPHAVTCERVAGDFKEEGKELAVSAGTSQAGTGLTGWTQSLAALQEAGRG